METVSSAATNPLHPHTGFAALRSQGLPSPDIRMPGPISRQLSREDRLQIYLDICFEASRDRQTVFICFVCEHFIVGRTCFIHHTKLCLHGHQHRRNPLPLSVPMFWRWLNCGYCFRQEVLASQGDHVPDVCHVMQWTRLVCRMAHRWAELSRWRCVSRRPGHYLPLPGYVLEYF